MNLGMATAIFDQINDCIYTDEQKGFAILMVSQMATHNSVTKSKMLDVIRYLLPLAFDVGETEPLTADELRRMDGEPVYIVTGLHLDCENDCGWAIVGIIHDDSIIISGKNGGCGILYYDNMGTRWNAYKNKPMEVAT